MIVAIELVQEGAVARKRGGNGDGVLLQQDQVMGRLRIHNHRQWFPREDAIRRLDAINELSTECAPLAAIGLLPWLRVHGDNSNLIVLIGLTINDDIAQKG